MRERAGSKEGEKHGFGQKKQGSQLHDMVGGVTALQISLHCSQNHLSGCVKWVTYGCRKKLLGQIVIVSCLDNKIFPSVSNLISQDHTSVFLSKVISWNYW